MCGNMRSHDAHKRCKEVLVYRCKLECNYTAGLRGNMHSIVGPHWAMYMIATVNVGRTSPMEVMVAWNICFHIRNTYSEITESLKGASSWAISGGGGCKSAHQPSSRAISVGGG